ncbi:uncharacterized protein LOC114935058 [Nylanderia fulva]|uniref:uncharacterized protein LOC114935058 n=1 Tax=Nylanderia fulva TaxID=613905 RepID=UPI0010FB674F|nr:uncharacterized protein LOC114935058 [Nylanderia fulva]
MEEVATITIQRMQPEKDICYEYVKSSLDSIAEAVLNCLREKHPNHSIFSTSAETFSYWRNNNIGDNHWDEAESTQIMDTIEEYIFGKLNFRLCQETDRNVENLCIDNVLKNKCGQKIILLIIYESVTRRLGLRCVLIKEELAIDEYYIFWMPNYARNRFENARCYDITFEEIPKRFHIQLLMNRENTLAIPTSEEMLSLLVQRFHYWLENVDGTHGIFTFYNSCKISNHQYYLRNEWLKKKKSYRMPENVRFAVGMIVKHGKEVGVIVGWDRFDIDRSDTISLDDTQNLDNTRKVNRFVMLLYQFFRKFTATNKFVQRQIYYTILTEDNRLCKVEEDAITLTTPKWIDNNEIGRYFCKFEGTHYVPNKMLAKIYPYNAATRAEIEIDETLFDL